MQRLKEVQYVFVVFKNCETSEHVQKIYEKETGPVSCLKCIQKTFIPSSYTDNTLFGKSIDVKPIVEPDEIIWENLKYTAKE